MKSRQLFMGIGLACALALAGPAHAHDMHGDMHHHMMGEGCCDKNLPPEKAKMSEGAMHQMMGQDKPLMERMRQLHEKMKAIGTADKFDKKAFLATGDEMAALHMKMEKNRTRMMASVAAQLTGEERRAMAKCMEQDFHRGEFGHGGWDPHGGEHHRDGGPHMDNSHNGGSSYNQ